MLYLINDLRTAVETAKRVLSKEKLDNQRTGQSSASCIYEGQSRKIQEKTVKMVYHLMH